MMTNDDDTVIDAEEVESDNLPVLYAWKVPRGLPSWNKTILGVV
jgi:hypothetical protein